MNAIAWGLGRLDVGEAIALATSVIRQEDIEWLSTIRYKSQKRSDTPLAITTTASLPIRTLLFETKSRRGIGSQQ